MAVRRRRYQNAVLQCPQDFKVGEHTITCGPIDVNVISVCTCDGISCYRTSIKENCIPVFSVVLDAQVLGKMLVTLAESR